MKNYGVNKMPVESSQPRKQRKFLFTAPFHLRRKMISAHLSKDLRKRFKIRSFPVRKGDEVMIVRGSRRSRKEKFQELTSRDTKSTSRE